MTLSSIGDDFGAAAGFFAMQDRNDSPPPLTPESDSYYADTFVGIDPSSTTARTEVPYSDPNPYLEQKEFRGDGHDEIGLRFVDEMSYWQSLVMVTRLATGQIGRGYLTRGPLAELRQFDREISEKLHNRIPMDSMAVAQRARRIGNACFHAGGYAWTAFKDTIYNLEYLGMVFPTEEEILAVPLS